jgi:hypothetical protein
MWAMVFVLWEPTPVGDGLQGEAEGVFHAF